MASNKCAILDLAASAVALQQNNEERRIPPRVDSKYTKCIALLNSLSSGFAGRIVTKVALMILIWSAILFTANRLYESRGCGDERENLFGLLVVFTFSLFFGDVLSFLRLPSLLGMLLAGLLIANTQNINAAQYIHKSWSVALRNIALVAILLRSGLELDPVALKKLKRTGISLAFGPCIAEALTVAVVANLLLELPWLWALQLGFVLAAVSPGIVVPRLLKLQEQGFGVKEGIPTFVMAASSCNNVLAISLSTVFLGIAFSTGDLVFNIFRVPLEILMGISAGCFSGFVLSFIPSNNQTRYLPETRFIMLLTHGIVLLLLCTSNSESVQYPGAWALAVITTAFVAAHGWRAKGKLPVVKLVDKLWLVFEPFMFGLIGAEVKMEYMTARLIGRGIAVLIIGLTLRILVTYLVTFGNDLKLKERVFICIASFPKATVQAAIGAFSLKTARQEMGYEEEEEYGKKILTLAVLVIFITAPLGAVGIGVTGPMLLQRQNNAVTPEEEIGLTVDDTAI